MSVDWGYGRAAFCAMGEGGEIAAEGLIPANEERAGPSAATNADGAGLRWHDGPVEGSCLVILEREGK
jgi:hypothetical protein